MMSLWVLLVLGCLCGAGRGTHHSHNAEWRVLQHLQQSAADNAAVYLPVGVSPTSPCGHALNTMAAALTNHSLWAAIMVDSWGKTPDGIFFGNKYNGVYDECLGAASPDGAIRGKYCKIHKYDITNLPTWAKEGTRTHKLPLGHTPHKFDFSTVRELVKQPRTIAALGPPAFIEYGSCIPNVCTQEELEISLIQYMLPQGIFPLVLCVEKDTELEFTAADVGFTSLITFLLALIGCSSLIDIYVQSCNRLHNKGVLRYLLVFSAYTNLGKIMAVNPKSAPGTITCLHAMRTLSMTWVIWCHQQTIPLPNTANLGSIIKKFDSILAQAILNGYPSVDTFFFLSGLLVSYSVLRAAKKTGTFNISLFYIHRLLRIIPPIGIMCGFVATVLRFYVSGIYAYIWHSYQQPMCAKYWWKDVFFVNNLLTDHGSCLTQTWYIAADMQMYLVAPLIILPLYFYKGWGKAWLVVVTAASVVIPAAIIYEYDLPPTALITAEKSLTDAFFDKVYMPPWTHASPWVAGIWLGYIFFRQGNTRYKMSPLVVAVGWTLAAITGLLVVFGMYSYNTLETPPPYEVMTQITFGGFHRLAWGAALGWMVFACHNGYGGLVDDFLSHPVWQPVSRLTYTTYLVAFPLQYVLFYNTHGGVFMFTHLNTLILTVGALVLSLACAVVLSLMAESPIVGLEKLLLSPGRSSSPRKPAGEVKGDVPSRPPHPDSDTPTKDTLLAAFSNPAFTAEEGQGDAASTTTAA